MMENYNVDNVPRGSYNVPIELEQYVRLLELKSKSDIYHHFTDSSETSITDLVNGYVIKSGSKIVFSTICSVELLKALLIYEIKQLSIGDLLNQTLSTPSVDDNVIILFNDGSAIVYGVFDGNAFLGYCSSYSEIDTNVNCISFYDFTNSVWEMKDFVLPSSVMSVDTVTIKGNPSLKGVLLIETGTKKLNVTCEWLFYAYLDLQKQILTLMTMSLTHPTLDNNIRM